MRGGDAAAAEAEAAASGRQTALAAKPSCAAAAISRCWCAQAIAREHDAPSTSASHCRCRCTRVNADGHNDDTVCCGRSAQAPPVHGDSVILWLHSTRRARWGGISTWVTPFDSLIDSPASLTPLSPSSTRPGCYGYGHVVTAAGRGRDAACRRYPAGKWCPCRAEQCPGVAALSGGDAPPHGVAGTARDGRAGGYGPRPPGGPAAANLALYTRPPATAATRRCRLLQHPLMRCEQPPRRCVCHRCLISGGICAAITHTE